MESVLSDSNDGSSSGLPDGGSRSSQLVGLFDQIELFRTLDPEIQAQGLSTFLVIAMNDPDPISMRVLADRVGIAQSSCSRNVAALGQIHRHGRPGHQLVESYEDPMDRRTKLVKLTPKGRRFAQMLGG